MIRRYATPLQMPALPPFSLDTPPRARFIYDDASAIILRAMPPFTRRACRCHCAHAAAMHMLPSFDSYAAMPLRVTLRATRRYYAMPPCAMQICRCHASRHAATQRCYAATCHRYIRYCHADMPMPPPALMLLQICKRRSRFRCHCSPHTMAIKAIRHAERDAYAMLLLIT